MTRDYENLAKILRVLQRKKIIFVLFNLSIKKFQSIVKVSNTADIGLKLGKRESGESILYTALF